MDQVSFRNEVYSVVASIPSGRVLTYGQIAYLVGRPQCSRMVGQAMHNPSLPPGGKQPGKTGALLDGTARTIGKGRCRFQKKRMRRPQGMWLGNLERIYFLAKILITNEQLVSKIPVPITPVQPKYCHEVPARKVPVEPPMK